MTRIIWQDGRTVIGGRGGPHREILPTSRGGPLTVWPRMSQLDRDLFVIGATLAGVVLACGAALGAIVGHVLTRND